ncbi:hypothetical protein V8F06_008495, partial [Rhypophila decipiens]
NRTRYIASNFQLQFDAPPQAGAIYTGGFSHCPNGTLAVGATTIFYQCHSGGFCNLDNRWWDLLREINRLYQLVMSLGLDPRQLSPDRTTRPPVPQTIQNTFAIPSR